MIELACEHAEAAGLVQLNEDEAGPYQAIPQPGASWQPEGHPALHPHEYERGGTAKLLTLFRPATGHLRAKGVLSAPKVVLHPWLQGELSEVLAEIEKKQPGETLPPESQRRLYAKVGKRGWATHYAAPSRHYASFWFWIIWPGISPTTWWAGCVTHGVLPLYTKVGRPPFSTWQSRCNALSSLALSSSQHPKNAQDIISWLEQTVSGWNKQPTPFVWNGKRRRRRERARVRRLAGSGAAVVK